MILTIARAHPCIGEVNYAGIYDVVASDHDGRCCSAWNFVYVSPSGVSLVPDTHTAVQL